MIGLARIIAGLLYIAIIAWILNAFDTNDARPGFIGHRGAVYLGGDDQ